MSDDFVRTVLIQMWMKDPNFDDFCTESGDRMYVADFDTDDRDDLICQRECHVVKFETCFC